MPKLKNVSPLGALDVPLLRRVVEADEVFEATEDQARVLLLQPDNYAPADKAAKALAASLAAEQDHDGADTPDDHDEDNGDAVSDSGTEGEGQ